MSRYLALSWLFFLAILAFGISLWNPLVFDDAVLIAQNRWLAPTSILEFFSSFFPPSPSASPSAFVGYRPLVLTTFALERSLFHGFPWMMRLANIVLHSLVAFLVFENARLVLRSGRVALFAASFFLLHPLQTNVITLIWKRSDLLVALGILMALLFARKWSEAPNRRNRFLMGVFLGALVALFSKESALILPIVIFAGEFILWIPKRSVRERLCFLYLPLILLSLAHGWLLFSRLPHALAVVHFQAFSYMPPSLRLDRWHYFQTQGGALLDYLQLTFWPTGFRVFHWIPPAHSTLDLRFILVALGVIAVLMGALLVRKKVPAVSFGIIWFFILLIPTSSLFPLEMPFDEDRLYLPIFGVALMVASLGKRLYEGFEAQSQKLGTKALWVFPTLLCALFLVHDVFRAAVWKNPVRLWTENVKDEPRDPRAWVNLGDALEAANKPKLAMAAFQKASEIEPDYGVPLLELGMLEVRLGELQKAEDDLQKAWDRAALPPDVLLNLGIVEAMKDHPAMAARYFSLCLTAQPSKTEALRNYATLLERNGDPDAALRALRTAILIDPEDPRTQIRLAYFIWDYRHDRDGALVFLNEVLKVAPTDPVARALARRLGVH